MEVQLQHFVKRSICLTMSPIKWNKQEKLRLYIMLSFIFFCYYVILQLLQYSIVVDTNREKR